jgi:dissimilatory sulfite reductase related protein
MGQQLLQSLGMDEYGLLREPGAWTPSLAREIAELDGVGQLTDDHWVMIHTLRDYYDEYEAAPPISLMCSENGLDKTCGSELFHTCMTAWRVSGLPDPGEEARAYLSAEL